MADEQSRPPFNRTSAIPAAYAWPSLLKRDGDELEAHYRQLQAALEQFVTIADDLKV
jgi:type I restriction enzyme M protein